jgi:hypothetical protein
MTDKRSSFGYRARLCIAGLSALIVALIIGCGGSGGGSLPSSTSSTSSTASTTTTTSTAGSTAGSSSTTSGTIPNGTLPSNVIFYGDAGDATVIGNGDENFDLYYVSPNGTGQALYVTVPASVVAAAANPSVTGQFIFAATPAGSSSSNYGIYSNTSLSTTGAKTIVAPTLVGVDAVTVTPDGNYVLFSAEDSNQNENIYKVQISGGTPVALYLGDDPEVDPTDTYIAYDQADPNNILNQYIWESKIDGSSPTQLTSGSFDEYPQFSKQSDRIGFDRVDGATTGAKDIWTYTIATKALTQITTSPDTQAGSLYITGASWSPDGTSLSFYSSPLDAGPNPAPTALYTATSTPTTPSTVVSGSTTPATVVTSVVSPVAETYWTGNNGRGASPLRGFEFRRKHAKRTAKK